MHKEIIRSHTNTNFNNGNHNVIMVALYTHNIIVFEFIPYHCIL